MAAAWWKHHSSWGVLVVIWGRPRSSLPSQLKYLELRGYSKLNPEDVVEVSQSVPCAPDIVWWIFSHAINFPYYHSFGLDLWWVLFGFLLGFFLSTFLSKLSLTCIQMYIPQSRCLKQIQSMCKLGRRTVFCQFPLLLAQGQGNPVCKSGQYIATFSYSTLTQQASEEA